MNRTHSRIIKIYKFIMETYSVWEHSNIYFHYSVKKNVNTFLSLLKRFVHVKISSKFYKIRFSFFHFPQYTKGIRNENKKNTVEWTNLFTLYFICCSTILPFRRESVLNGSAYRIWYLQVNAFFCRIEEIFGHFFIRFRCRFTTEVFDML